MSEAKNYSMTEVTKHVSDAEGKEDVWLVIGNTKNGGPKVYDISKYVTNRSFLLLLGPFKELYY